MMAGNRADSQSVVQPAIRVLLVDDHPPFRIGMRVLLEQHATIKVVGEASTGAEALQLAVQRQDQAQADAYMITATAQADAERMRLTAEAQQIAIRTMIAELSNQGVLGEKFIEYLIAQELKENSKWVINGDSSPILDLR